MRTYSCLHEYIRYTNYQVRGSNILSLPRINTTSYGSKSIRYFGPKIWNFLDDNLRTQPDLQSFKKFVRHVAKLPDAKMVPHKQTQNKFSDPEHSSIFSCINAVKSRTRREFQGFKVSG